MELINDEVEKHGPDANGPEWSRCGIGLRISASPRSEMEVTGIHLNGIGEDIRGSA